MTKKHCRVCGVELSEENWYASMRKGCGHICKKCQDEYRRSWRKANPEKARAQLARWRKANPEKVRAIRTRNNRKQGKRPFDENKECSSYLGVHVAERVLSHVFKDVGVVPYGNPGYDFTCNKGKRIDVKSACLYKRDKGWAFRINRNTIPDFFLCLAFDNREDLTPLHVWLLPGHKFSHLIGTSISQSTIHKWDAYQLDISKISDCCNTIRGD